MSPCNDLTRNSDYFIREMESVYCAVRESFLNIILVLNLVFKWLLEAVFFSKYFTKHIT
jgi:hypothetical protein